MKRTHSIKLEMYTANNSINKLLSESTLLTKIIIDEFAGIDRKNEPLTMGIPIPKGLIHKSFPLAVIDPERGPLPIQTEIMEDMDYLYTMCG